MRHPARALFLVVVIHSVFSIAQSKLPNTPVRDVTEDYFGTNVSDPYRWLEKTADPEVVAWMKAQNDYTRAILASIPGRDQLRDRIKALDNAGDVVSGLQVWGGALLLLQDRARLRQSQAVYARQLDGCGAVAGRS